MQEFGKFVIYTIIGAVIFMLVYSVWVNPQSIKSTSERITAEATNTLKTTKINDNYEPSSTTLCINEIKRKAEISIAKLEVGSPKIYVKEYKSFTDSSEAIEYLDLWGFNDNFLYNKDHWEKQMKNSSDIVVALVRFENTAYDNYVGILQPILCVDGKMTESSKNKFW